MKKELLEKITQKKEFSQLPKKDIELIFSKFDKEKFSDEEKVKLTRELLLNVFTFSLSKKLLSIKEKDPEWILKKHPSTRERFSYYKEVYKKLLKGMDKKITIFDFGAGVNGFSYFYFKDIGFKAKYIAVEAIGQLVKSMGNYFKKEKLNAKAIHESLFELEKIKKLVKGGKGSKIVFLFKILDSLERVERNYSKKLILELAPFVDRFVISFATMSLVKRGKIWVKRTWISNFIKENFNLLQDFEIGAERYFVFEKLDKIYKK